MSKIHFGYSTSKNYPYILELANKLSEHRIKNTGINQWHTVSYNEDSEEHLNIVANIYQKYNSRYPNIEGSSLRLVLNCCKNNGIYKQTTNYIYAPSGKKAEVSAKKFIERNNITYPQAVKLLEEISDEISKDYEELENHLVEKGYIEKERFGVSFKEKLTPIASPIINEIKNNILDKNYDKAVQLYSEYSKHKLENNNTYVKELIYLKRLANVQLGGHELMALMNVKSIDGLIGENKNEFIQLVEDEIRKREEKGQPHPLGIILDQAPTMDDLIKKRDEHWNNAVYFKQGKIKRGNQKVTEDNFSVTFDKCVEGSVLKIFPDQVRYCEIKETPESQKYWKLWTPIDPDTYKKETIDKGLHLGYIDSCHPKEKSYKLIRDEMFSINDPEQIKLSPVAGNGLFYTGETHQVGSAIYYQINILRKDIDKEKKIGNTFLELVGEIFRDAENVLRENHGLPRIGEGWVSEMRMYELIKSVFSDAKHHAKPKWLAPQHLDVYVETKKIAFEYQGLQHYQPIEYFGGLESHNAMKKLDKRKARKCRFNEVQLIYWKYDEPITKELLLKKLKPYV